MGALLRIPLTLLGRGNGAVGRKNILLNGCKWLQINRIFFQVGYDGWYDLEVLSDNGMFGNSYADSLWNVPPVQLVGRARAAFQGLCAASREL